ncbi:AraC family transcriptional regulator [Nocardia australiensis]|uniref:AraC family transcriptional regulator n=1 Tax=Nocardia australiensis TaxID=2887191 RepID=UPI001D133836|nr:helix-turn-helix transcriptional regulator [Nocardia australiensis]
MRNVPLHEVDAVERDVLPIATDYTPGFLLDWHEHRRAQFLYGATGTMVVETDDGTWTVPTAQGVMIPPATPHRVRMLDVSTSSLYIEPAAVPWWPVSCVVVEVTSLVRELLLAAAELSAEYDHNGREGAITSLLLYELASLGPLPLHIDLPRSADLAALCRAYFSEPEVGMTNAEWARRVTMSERAFTRRFHREVGTSPAAWRLRARLLAAIPMLRAHPVARVAAVLGYASPAAFSFAFSREFGMAPSVTGRR